MSLHRHPYLLSAVYSVALIGAMVGIAAYDPLSWHAHDAGYPSVALLVGFAAGVLVLVVTLAYLGRQVRYQRLFLSGITLVAGGILGNVAGILTIHALGGGNSAADIWFYPLIWYIGNPADGSLVVGGILLLAWVAGHLLPRTGEQARNGILAAVAAIPLLAVGGYGVARADEVTAWQPRPLEQLTRVVAHRAGLNESKLDRACAAQFAFVYHRPASVELTEKYCPRILGQVASSKSASQALVASAPPSTFGRRRPASKPPVTVRDAPSVVVTISRNGSVAASLVVPSPPRYVPPAPVRRLITNAQRRELPCVNTALKVLKGTEVRFEVIAIEDTC